ncbi:EAL domain-containing protein [Vibrio sp. SM6]|uniref:EAL domain-containing protein n=1 Tax=Vibrio agarilyticus TaxID=2726741 RepID=A0A7X8TRW7_9VIBR|nr:EAL domain-containing protein [Vibrio agarilyticus]NLS13649.1 EAL domain-containing protein [Vibrio agarilyticus]
MQTVSWFIERIEALYDKLTTRHWDDNKQYAIQILSSQSAEKARAYAQALTQALPHAHIVGSSVSHLIQQQSILTSGSLIIINEFQHTQMTSAAVPYQYGAEKDSERLRHALNLQASSCAILSFSCQVAGQDYAIYRAFDRATTPPIAGGLAYPSELGAWVLHQTQTYPDGVVAIALHSDVLRVWTGAYSEWNPVGMPHVVTKANQNRLITLGDEPVYDHYKHYLADGADVDLLTLRSFPLYRERHGKKEVCVANEIHPDGSMSFDRSFCVGDILRFCYTHPSLTLEQLKYGITQLAFHQPQTIWIYNCASRLDFIEGTEEVAPFTELAMVNGGYCMGELYASHDEQEILHHSLTYLGLREADEVPDFKRPAAYQGSSVSPLFSLIRNAINDLNQSNHQMEYLLERQAQKLSQSFRTDSRTGLANRVALQEYLAGMNEDEHLLTLKLINFSQINEKYGYSVGDRLLKDLSQHFRVQLRKGLGRIAATQLYSIGVGEWAFVFRANEPSAQIKHPFTLFADLVEQHDFSVHGAEELDYLSVSLCGGLASRRDFPTVSGDELLLKAIEARRAGRRNNTHICNALDIQVSEEVRKEQLAWHSRVSRAILKHQIVTYAQPIFSAQSHQIYSHECLVRIIENGQVIAPGQFLPIISDTHLYSRLSRHMIESTLNYMKDKSGVFSINLSPQDLFSDKTLYVLENAISKLNDPTRLGLEVLESEQITDYDRMIEVCGHFRRLGARIIVDDFGSGYSNFDEIAKLEPEIIKLDGSLIRHIHQDQRQRKMTAQLVKLCQVLNAKTVAEFVHNQAVCYLVESMGVDYLQGFHLGEPKRLF